MIPQSSMDQYRRQQAIAGTTAASVGKLWRRVGPDFSAEWPSVSGLVLGVIQAGREATVRVALPYTDSVLTETNVKAAAAGSLVASRFIRDAPDGSDLGTLLDRSVIVSKTAIRDGATVREALRMGGQWLTGTTLTVMADT